MELVYGTQQVIIHNGRSVSVSMDGGEAHLSVFTILNQLNTAQNPLILLNFHSCIQWTRNKPKLNRTFAVDNKISTKISISVGFYLRGSHCHSAGAAPECSIKQKSTTSFLR